MAAGKPNAFVRLFRGETSYDFAGRWKIWFAISGAVILIGLISLFTRGLNFSIDFKGGTVWEVPSTATVSDARDAIDHAVPGMGQATITILTNTQTGQRTVKVEAGSDLTANSDAVVVGHGCSGRHGPRQSQRRPAQRHRPIMGARHHHLGDKGGDHLPHRRIGIHMASLRRQNGVCRARRARPRHPCDGRYLLALGIPGQPGHSRSRS